MDHKSVQDLWQMVNDAKQKVKVGGTYYHYKHSDRFYTLMDVIIIEATESIGVLYRAEYDDLKGIVFMRPLENFLEQVDVNGSLINRFTLVE